MNIFWNRSDCLSRSFGAALLAATLAACGGGGGSGSGSDSPSVPNDTARLECHVEDSKTGAPVAGANVNLQAGTAVFNTQTNESGNCTLDLPAGAIANVNFPAATVTKDGYEPQTIICESLKAGSACVRDVGLIPLASYVSIPVGGDVVMHLGDDFFNGSTNSQFQKATDGSELIFPIPDWATQVAKPGIAKATVVLDAKGWQTGTCSNVIALQGEIGTQAQAGGVSPSDGYWGGGLQVPFSFDVASVGVTDGALRLTSGPCSGEPDLDDFEVNRIRVYFCSEAAFVANGRKCSPDR